VSAADKVNILLVDDQPAKLLSYEAMLSDLGENLIKASSGARPSSTSSRPTSRSC
jgi:response regulator RpfG family c-di-GMP phosphodiesterase